jgi:hypothetical protein
MSKWTTQQFEDNNELPRILREVAEKIERLKEFPFTLRDVNGNKVGTANVLESHNS